MERPRVCVIDNSPSIRETVSIVLGDQYRVRGLTADEFARDASVLKEADLLIVGTEILSGAAAVSFPDGLPLLRIDPSGAGASPSSDHRPTLPWPFGPDQLLQQVQSLLAGRMQFPRSLAPDSALAFPLVPREVAALARRAARTQFPVLICGEQGTGKARLARAIHALGRDGRFVALPASIWTRAALEQAGGVAPGNLAVFVNDVHALTADGQHLLLELMDTGGFASPVGWHRVRLICGTTQSFEDLARSRTFSKELFYRTSVLPISLPPLRERAADMPMLAEHIAATLARLLSTDPVQFTARALERMAHYLWFGNLAELETVLTRSIVLAPGRRLDADDLLFGYGRIVARGSDNHSAAREAAAEPARHEAVDLIINELAHEFKNPMVTIKTVAQHLERLLADETGREQVARLTGEAVDRMDRALENLLQFTRFRTPAPGAIQLNMLLSPCLTELAPTLAERRVLLDYRPPESVTVFVDSVQILYAFENLLRVIGRDLPEEHTLSIRPLGATGGVVFEFSGAHHPVAAKLSAFLGHEAADAEAALPLGVVFAKTLIERNGGRVEVDSSGDAVAITVWLPLTDEILPEDGKAASLNH